MGILLIFVVVQRCTKEKFPNREKIYLRFDDAYDHRSHIVKKAQDMSIELYYISIGDPPFKSH